MMVDVKLCMFGGVGMLCGCDFLCLMYLCGCLCKFGFEVCVVYFVELFEEGMW